MTFNMQKKKKNQFWYTNFQKSPYRGKGKPLLSPSPCSVSSLRPLLSGYAIVCDIGQQNTSEHWTLNKTGI